MTFYITFGIKLEHRNKVKKKQTVICKKKSLHNFFMRKLYSNIL